MDPQANLFEILTLLSQSGDNIDEHDRSRLVELLDAQRDWIAGNGFLPRVDRSRLKEGQVFTVKQRIE